MKPIIILLFLFSLTACSVGFSPDTQDLVSNPSTIIDDTIIIEPSPTQPIGTGWLEEGTLDTVSLSGVMDMKFTYLDSENKSYSSGTFAEIIARYPRTVVYFYPKDGTPNCTIQALDFSLMLADFRAKGYNVIGISKDPIDSHMRFAESNELKIELLQDADGDLLRAFGAEGPLQTYGNGDELSDIIRSTYIIDSEGTAYHAYRDVIAMWHARRIYEIATGEIYSK